MITLKYIYNKILFIPLGIKNLYFIFVKFREIERGGISVDTFIKLSSDKKKLGFRNVIQFDGSIINFMPPPDLFMNDPDDKKLFLEKYTSHQEKVRNILNQLDLDFTYTIKLVYYIILIGLWILSILIFYNDVDKRLLIIPSSLWIYFFRRYFFKFAKNSIGFFIRKYTLSAVNTLVRKF